MKRLCEKALALALTCALALICLPSVRATAQEEIAAAAQKRAELQEKLAEINRQLADIGDSVDKAQRKADTYATRVSLVEDQIEEIRQSIELKTEELALRQQELEMKEQQRAETYSMFKDRLRAMYMNNRTASPLSLLAGNGFGEFLINMHNVGVISQHDSDLVDRLADEQAELEEIRAAVEIELDSLETDQTTLSDKYSELAALYQEADGELSTAEALQSATEEDYNTIRGALEQANAELEALMGTGSEIYVGGYFAWPVPGYSVITSPFGYRTIWGSVSWHGGIDISGSNAAGVFINGADVIASNSGTVIRAQYGTTGYGYHVMIDHGGNNWTVYGHLSRILVAEGQFVAQGDVIGKVGTTGNSTGPHLHFEIRLNGSKVDPLTQLVR